VCRILEEQGFVRVRQAGNFFDANGVILAFM